MGNGGNDDMSIGKAARMLSFQKVGRIPLISIFGILLACCSQSVLGETSGIDENTLPITDDRKIDGVEVPLFMSLN